MNGAESAAGYKVIVNQIDNQNRYEELQDQTLGSLLPVTSDVDK